MIVEDPDSSLPQRYRANNPELFFKAKYELPPGTVLFADISAFLEFIEWTPEAKHNGVWNGPFPASSEPGVYILEASSIPSGLSAPVCLLPAATSVAMDSSASGSCVGATCHCPLAFMVPRSYFTGGQS